MARPLFGVGAAFICWAAVSCGTPVGGDGRVVAGGVDGPLIYSDGSLDEGEDAIVIGVVDVDGDCLYLNAADDPTDPSLRVPVVWPDGTQWQDDPAGVVLTNGDTALVGDVVTGAGGYHQPGDVARLAGLQGAELAAECADGEHQEVAIFSPGIEVRRQEIRFDDPQFVGLCESMESEFAEGEPSPYSTADEAVAGFVAEHAILQGLVVEGGTITYRGKPVGSYQLVERPGDTFVVASGDWCFPDD